MNRREFLRSVAASAVVMFVDPTALLRSTVQVQSGRFFDYVPPFEDMDWGGQQLMVYHNEGIGPYNIPERLSWDMVECDPIGDLDRMAEWIVNNTGIGWMDRRPVYLKITNE